MVAHGVGALHVALGLRAAVHHQVPGASWRWSSLEHDGDLRTAGGVLRGAAAGLAAGRDELQVELLHPVVRRFQEHLAHGAG